VLFGASVLATVAVASVVVAAPWNNPWAGDPLGNTRFFVDPYSQAAQAAAASSSDAARAELLGKIAGQPTGIWLGAEIAPSVVRDEVRNVLREASAQRAVPLFVLYAFPFHGCTANGDQGAVSAMVAGYQQWIEHVAQGIGTSKAVLVVEPDALAQSVTLSCLTAGQQASRLAVLRTAVTRLARLPHAAVYLDAGNARWQPVPVMARLLRAAGVLAVRGFALNVSNFDPTSAEASYGHQLSTRLDNAHFVIDTSRNGVGSLPQTWCNPPGQALGLPPTANTPDPRVDAWLWIKQPGTSDGTCGGGPPAGTFWPAYAISLAANAPW
jgi:endoglucanase